MNNRDRENWGRFIEGLGKRAETCCASRDGMALHAIARKLSRMAERHCNEPMDDKQIAAMEKRETRLLKEAQDISAQWPTPATVYHQGDPRGLSLYLIFPEDIPEGREMEAHYTRGLAVPE